MFLEAGENVTRRHEGVTPKVGGGPEGSRDVALTPSVPGRGCLGNDTAPGFFLFSLKDHFLLIRRFPFLF